MSSGAHKPPVRGMEAFGFRDFRRYQLARVMAILGAEAQSVAVAWQVYSMTHRPLDLGYTGLALFFIGTGRAFSGPASAALIPHLVPEEHFVNAVTWGGAIFQFSNITGPALGGILFTLPLTGLIPDASLEGAGIVYVFTLGTLAWFLVMVASLD